MRSITPPVASMDVDRPLQATPELSLMPRTRGLSAQTHRVVEADVDTILGGIAVEDEINVGCRPEQSGSAR